MANANAEPKQMSSGMKRVLAALCLLPIVFGVLFVGSPLIEISFILVAVLLAWEWSGMVPNKSVGTYMGAYAFAAAVMITFPKYWGLGVMAAVAFFTLVKSFKEERRFLLTLGVPYISLGVASLVWIYQEMGLSFLLWVLFVVWGMDTGGYVVGKTLKGPKLMPKVSPNKTWSGLIGGMLFAAIAGLAVVYFIEMQNKALWGEAAQAELKIEMIYMGVLSAVFGFISQMGDLVESAIKRKVGVKDSSHLIPGHGGVFDRVDALIFVAPFVYLWFSI